MKPHACLSLLPPSSTSHIPFTFEWRADCRNCPCPPCALNIQLWIWNILARFSHLQKCEHLTLPARAPSQYPVFASVDRSSNPVRWDVEGKVVNDLLRLTTTHQSLPERKAYHRTALHMIRRGSMSRVQDSGGNSWWNAEKKIRASSSLSHISSLHLLSHWSRPAYCRSIMACGEQHSTCSSTVHQ